MAKPYTLKAIFFTNENADEISGSYINLLLVSN